MGKYKITIEETVVDEFDVFADSAEDAMRIAEKNYKNGNFVLCSGEVQHKQMAIIEPAGKVTEFIEF